MIKLKRVSENKCNVLIDIKLDESDLDLLDTFGLINEEEIESVVCERDKPVVPKEMTKEMILLTIVNHQMSKRLSGKSYSSLSRELFFRFIYENIPDCLSYHFKDTLPDAIVIRKDYILSHGQDQGVKHLKQLFPKLYSQVFDPKRDNDLYMGPLTTKDGEKAVILAQLKSSFMLNTFYIFHEWGHHLYRCGLMDNEREIPSESYKLYRFHIGKSSWEEKRCDWYAIKKMYEIYGPGVVWHTIYKLNKIADSRTSEFPFVDNKYRVALLCRLTRRYFKDVVNFIR